MNPLTNVINRSGKVENILTLMKMMQGKDPNTVMQLLAQKNPQFAEFARSCQGKTPDEVAKAYGIDLSIIKNIIR